VLATARVPSLTLISPPHLMRPCRWQRMPTRHWPRHWLKRWQGTNDCW
jgi:hypothetical protein